MIQITDQIGNIVNLSKPAERIICLVPSITELLFHLGLANRLVGITKFCELPKEARTLVKMVGGTKQIRTDLVRTLQPDLVICNKEENTKEVFDWLSSKYTCYVSDIKTVNDALEMIVQLGTLTNTLAKAASLVKEIEELRAKYKLSTTVKKQTCLYLIWREPYMVAGTDTFIQTLLAEANLENVVNEARYPELNFWEIGNLQPELILLSSEPYPFKEKHQTELKAAFPNAKVLLVDGKLFSWYGLHLKNFYERALQNTLLEASI